MGAVLGTVLIQTGDFDDQLGFQLFSEVAIGVSLTCGLGVHLLEEVISGVGFASREMSRREQSVGISWKVMLREDKVSKEGRRGRTAEHFSPYECTNEITAMTVSIVCQHAGPPCQ